MVTFEMIWRHMHCRLFAPHRHGMEQGITYYTELRKWEDMWGDPEVGKFWNDKLQELQRIRKRLAMPGSI